MTKHWTVVLVALALAGCGRASTAPTSQAPSIAGRWEGRVSYQAGDPAFFSSSFTVTSRADISQSNGSVTGRFSFPDATFSGSVTDDRFEGTMRVTGSSGCVSSSPLSGSVSTTSLRLASNSGSGCDWWGLFVFELTRP